ncbi:MAG: zinc ribbon domain-containing protein, partial [Planctomycetota bacterium]
MGSTITCPACLASFVSQADLCGKRVRCRCGHVFVVPSDDTQAKDPPFGFPETGSSEGFAPQAASPLSPSRRSPRRRRGPRPQPFRNAIRFFVAL